MSDKKTQVINNDKYYSIISTRYGADIATLIKLRFNEIHRIVTDELNEGNIQNTKPISTQKLVSLFLENVIRLLKKDRDLNNMFAEDAELRLWAVMLFLNKSNV